jgi:hypothetical protein
MRGQEVGWPGARRYRGDRVAEIRRELRAGPTRNQKTDRFGLTRGRRFEAPVKGLRRGLAAIILPNPEH